MQLTKYKKGGFICKDESLFMEHDESDELIGTIGINLCPHSTNILSDAIAKVIPQKDVLNVLIGSSDAICQKQ